MLLRPECTTLSLGSSIVQLALKEGIVQKPEEGVSDTKVAQGTEDGSIQPGIEQS